jgi:hypothetical protein
VSPEPTGPVVTGFLGTAPAEAALRYAFGEADHRGVALLVILTGVVPPGEDACQLEVVRRWAEKYTDVAVTTSIRRRIDPAVVLTAASRGVGLLVVQQPENTATAAVVEAVSRRARCPVVIACQQG